MENLPRFHQTWTSLESNGFVLWAFRLGDIELIDTVARNSLSKVVAAFRTLVPKLDDCWVISISSQGNRADRDGQIKKNRPSIVERAEFISFSLAEYFEKENGFVVDVHHGMGGSRSKDDWLPSFMGISGKPSDALAEVANRCRKNFRIDIFVSTDGRQVPAPSEIENAIDESPAFDPANLEEGRIFRARRLAIRQGQREFRNRLLKAYGGRCAVSACGVAPALEACHILSYSGKETNHIQNGILLRADLHSLFDLGVMWIDSNRFVTKFGESARKDYSDLDGSSVTLPKRVRDRPSIKALAIHAAEAKLRGRVS